MSDQPQIFQTGTRTRWQRFKWAARALLFLLLLGIITTYIAIRNMGKNEPGISLESKAIKKVLTGKASVYRESKIGKDYRGFRKAIDARWARNRNNRGLDANLDLSNSPLFSDSIGIRAAFYVAWDPQSFYSLEKNISKINLVIPEWFFIDPNADTLFTSIDKRALSLMKSAKVEIMPILSNNYKQIFRGEAVHRILTNPIKKLRLINDLLRLLKQYDFAGINVDFEELQETTDATLISFQKELYEKLHANNFLVTQDVIPFNDDYNFKALAKYNDYLILMAYDEHHNESKPGPISSQRWIQAALDKMDNYVPAEKIILGMAGYGYDWKLKSNKVENFSYQEALANARESDAVVEFDNSTYNLHYQYYDGADSLHEVHFTDAATNFNTLRFVTECRLAGTALWRLGSEDSRLWEFYNKSMTKTALKNFDFKVFSNVPAGLKPDYIGEGEVLDVIATPTDGYITPEIDSVDMLISEEAYTKLPSTYVIRRFGSNKKRQLVLTFDDGPDPLYTRQILDTLAYYHVPANFFVVGIEAENNIPLIKRIFREGHELGNHTFFHPNMARVSTQRANLEIDLTRLLIECITGHSTIMFRAPFNADSEPDRSEELIPVALSRKKNYLTVGATIDPEDWQKEEIDGFNADTIFNRVVKIYEKRIHNPDLEDTTGVNGNIILLHDAGGDRSATVAATGMIIRFFQSRGYTFTTVANLVGKKPDDMMPPVAKGSGYNILQIEYLLAEAGYLLGAVLESLFIGFLILGAARLMVTGTLAFLQKRKECLLPFTLPTTGEYPLVSIIVPAYNEEVNAVNSLHNILKCDYPLFEIIFVDDGSNDTTYEKVKTAFNNHPQIKIFTKPNGGKATALNFGISHSSANYLVCIDADTQLALDAVSKLMQHFFTIQSGEIGAVAGTVKVGNEINILTRWQSIEYIVGQNFDRKAFTYLNAVTVVPGAIGAYSKKALADAGGFTPDTLAEDCDLTIRILKSGYLITNEPLAVAYTEAPETIKQFMKQRFRWCYGVMQVFWKYKELLFNTKHKTLGFIAFPDILLFKYIIPLFTPIADLLMLIGLLTGNAEKIGAYYLVFIAVDATTAAIAFAFAKEKPWKLVWLIPQRLIYRWLMLVVLFRSFRKAVKGELQHWGVLKRTGNVKDVESDIVNNLS